ncbi:S41 family peptidase [Mitsuaria sp. WAJ17]|uniref:S41 family peptidase n=1 Tax=Mitsuaria sp. WAJ17 TaxID=2761452 RepID=UPI001600D7E7|nr:S41 family peptidase [Mitsuaria sp. WAJ17]MBB2483743.1 S41 family peptidase [Mitsuaria sp. WAJ17]
MMKTRLQGLALAAVLMLSPLSMAAPAAGAPLVLAPAEQAVLGQQIGLRLKQDYHDLSRVPAALAALKPQDGALTGPALAESWTRLLQTQLQDAHARLVYSPEALPPDAEEADEAPSGPPPEVMRYLNCGVERVEHYPGNIGYLRVDAMAPPEACAPTLVAALQVLAHSDALILDLRRNRGGSPAMVQWLASHFLPPQTALSAMVRARDASHEALMTQAGLPGPDLARVPLYVLTSSKTFSAGEHLAYDLQQAGRAKVVGEPSGGGANPGTFRTVHPHFRLWVSLARSVSPVTGGNWEGDGVQPDERVKAPEARRMAYGRALKDLVLAKAPSAMPGEREELLGDLEKVLQLLGL